MVDSLASGASARKGVRVRLPPRAPSEKPGIFGFRVLFCLHLGQAFHLSFQGAQRPRESAPQREPRTRIAETGLPAGLTMTRLGPLGALRFPEQVSQQNLKSRVDIREKLWYYNRRVQQNTVRASGGIGRLAGFRCQCSQGRAGSTPASRTKPGTSKRMSRVFVWLSFYCHYLMRRRKWSRDLSASTLECIYESAEEKL